MYRQILIHPEDRCYQHILWRSDPSSAIQEFELNTITYGLTCSPFLAIRVLHQLAHDEGHQFPLAADTLLNDTYVDDIVTGAWTEADAILLRNQLIELLRKGCFQLSKWSSNHKPLLHSLPKEENQSFVILDEDSSIKVLGVRWEPVDDVFEFIVKSPDLKFTKRDILSCIARIFDPEGFLAPMIFNAKRILQDVWRSKLNWDELVPASLREEWRSFVKDLEVVKDIRIRRYFGTSQEDQVEIVGFCDASLLGYAAAIYLRVFNAKTRQVGISLIKSKTRLSPIKFVSIPRLELCGALLLTELVASLAPLITKMKIKHFHYFTDSTIVLHWLATSPEKLKTFVANQTTQILEVTSLNCWRHVMSSDNPADLASRGCSATTLKDSELWWHGPKWLHDDIPSWPNGQISPLVNLPELKSTIKSCNVTTAVPMEDIEWFSRFSSFSKLVCTFAFILRFANNSRFPHMRNKGPLTSSEIHNSTLQCIKVIQHRHFPLSKNSSLDHDLKSYLHLQPFLDPDGYIRVGGRLQHSHLPEASKHPLLLPKGSNFTRLLIRHYHETYYHAGPTLLASLLRGRYWIVGARPLIRDCLIKCVVCRRHTGRPAYPLMGNLPEYRFKEGRAFLHVGVDFAGPFMQRFSSQRKATTTKCYLCLFVCLATKAVHLELVSSLSTEAFLTSLHRFIARRGHPEKLFSDCGTNFIGANRYLKELYQFLSRSSTKEEFTQRLAPQEIEWHFNPPSAPHFGGLWEAGVKSVKSILRKVMGSTPLTYEELSTVFCRIEALLNSRPLCALSSTPDELEALTPGHLLIGAPLTSIPDKSILSLKESSLSRWQIITQRQQHFWKRWRLEYLNTLQQRQKWRRPTPSLSLDSLVLIKDDSPPGSWPLGRVIHLHPGKDGHVRVVTLRTARGIFQRPVAKLVLLRQPDDSS